jgi:hypothetical protein
LHYLIRNGEEDQGTTVVDVSRRNKKGEAVSEAASRMTS